MPEFESKFRIELFFGEWEFLMNRWAAFALLAVSTGVLAQSTPMPSGSTVFIEPMGGYESYLAAAIVKKHAPIVIVTDKAKAQYLITSSVIQKAANQPALVINNSVSNGSNNTQRSGNLAGYPMPGSFGQTNVSISVIDGGTSQVIFAYAVGNSRANNQIQSTAEACAKHLKEFIEKSEKAKK
jgi:hypothetical protein